jgi:restriction system protein
MSVVVPNPYDKLALNITKLLYNGNLSEYEIENELLSLFGISSEIVRDMLLQMERLDMIYFNDTNHWGLTSESISLIESNDERLQSLLSSFQFGEISFEITATEDIPLKIETQLDSLEELRSVVELQIREYNISLKSRLKELLLTANPFRLEEIAIEVLVKSGEGKYGVGTPKTHDGGIDGYIFESLLKRGGMPIQTKQHAEHKYVTAEEIHGFLSVCKSKGAKTGYYVTTSYFSDTAIDTSKLELCLIDGEMLINLILKSKLGLLKEPNGYLFFIDENYFLCPPLPRGTKFEITI